MGKKRYTVQVIIPKLSEGKGCVRHRDTKEKFLKLLTITMNTVLLLGILTAFISCDSQNQKSPESKPEQVVRSAIGDTVAETGRNIRCILQDSKRNFWFATDGEGVFRFNGTTITRLTGKQGLCSNFVWYIEESKDGTLWFKTREGVCSFDGKQFTTVRSADNLIDAIDINNAFLLIDCYYDGNQLLRFRLPRTSSLADSNSHSPYAVYCTYKDSKGNIWFGTESRGVCRYDGRTFSWLDDKELGVAVRSIFEDTHGIIWIGNNGYGLFRYDGKTLTNFTRQHKLEDPDFLKKLQSKEGTLARVWSITDDRQGNLWIGTIDNGLWKYDGSALSHFTTKDGLTSNAIWTVYRDRDGTLWIGTDGGGITKYDGTAFTAFRGAKQNGR
jgi:ligand-binding sensor domain-containing protein